MAIEFGYTFQFNARKYHQCKHHERNVRRLIDSNYLLWTKVMPFLPLSEREKKLFSFHFVSFLLFHFPLYSWRRQHVSMENVSMQSFNQFDFVSISSALQGQFNPILFERNANTHRIQKECHKQTCRKPINCWSLSCWLVCRCRDRMEASIARWVLWEITYLISPIRNQNKSSQVTDVFVRCLSIFPTCVLFHLLNVTKININRISLVNEWKTNTVSFQAGIIG